MKINITFLLIILFFIFGCYDRNNNEYKINFTLIDGISSYIVEYKRDSVIICGINRNQAIKNDTLNLYLKNGVFCTKQLNNQEELIMSNVIKKDSTYEFYNDEEFELFKYRIKIHNQGDSLYTITIWRENPIIDEEKGTTPIYLYIDITYDKEYQIKTITHWNIFETFKADDK